MPDASDNALVDLRWMATRGGVGRIGEHLVAGMREVGEPPFGVTLWGDEELLASRPPWCDVASSRFIGNELAGQRQSAALPPHRGAVYTHQIRPLRDWRSISFVHDTIQLTTSAGLKRVAVRTFLRTVVSRSHTVATISEHSRHAISAEFGRPVSDIVRVVLPMDGALAARVRARRRALGTAGEDLLYVGRVDPNKNVDGLLSAFARSGADGRRRLHLFGADEAQRVALLATAASLGLRNLEIATERSDDGLVDAYARAAAVVVPSLVEGWGFPSFEAIACGIPVIASHGGALPEQAAYAVAPFELVDVSAPDALARAIADAETRTAEQMDADSHAALDGAPTNADLARDVLDLLERVR